MMIQKLAVLISIPQLPLRMIQILDKKFLIISTLLKRLMTHFQLF